MYFRVISTIILFNRLFNCDFYQNLAKKKLLYNNLKDYHKLFHLFGVKCLNLHKILINK